MDQGWEPLDDSETLYRRVPAKPGYVAPGPKPSHLCFHPREHDPTGVSVYRAKYKTPEQVAQNSRGKSYYVAVLNTGDLRRHGIRVVPRPFPGDPGHAELPDMTYENRMDREVKEAEVLLSQDLCLQVLGPYPL